MKDIEIGKSIIGLKQPVFISAEVGTTCNGDVATAKKLIDAAKEVGMDAVKFQIIGAEELFSDKSITYTYRQYSGKVVTENMTEMLKQYEMSPRQWREVMAYAKKRNIIIFATTDYMDGVDLMEELGMPAQKISTWDCNYYPFIRKIARTGKPVIIDLGASPMDEIVRILDVFKEEKNDQIVLLHCFHTPHFEEMNLQTIEYLRNAFGCLSGFSAPDTNNALDYVTLPYKPVYIEKRLTLDRTDARHHHAQALEPQEMKTYVQTIRNLERALGTGMIQPSRVDFTMRQEHFRSLVAKRPIKKGEKLSPANVTAKRPLKGGIDPMYLEVVRGRMTKRALKEDEQITWGDI